MREMTLCGCGRGKNCPKVVETPEGYVISDDDQPGKPSIKLTAEEASLFADFHAKRSTGGVGQDGG